MDVIFHPHAVKKLRDRGIKQSTVESLIKNPDAVVSGKHGRKIAQKSFGRYIIRAIYEKKENRVLVLTAYTAKAERYK